MDGQNLVGTYTDAVGANHVYTYDANGWKSFDYPGVTGGVYPEGISGGIVVGYYYNPSAPPPGNHCRHGFLFDGSTWRSVDAGGAFRSDTDTILTDISGNTAVGYWNDYLSFSNPFPGFIMDVSTRIVIASIECPWGDSTYPHGVSGNSIVGGYYGNGGSGSFLLTTPEPATLSLLAIGGLLVARRRRA